LLDLQDAGSARVLAEIRYVLNGTGSFIAVEAQVFLHYFTFRFFFGKNKVMSLALGRSKSDEYRPGLRKIAKQLQGQTGLLFTNASEQQVLR